MLVRVGIKVTKDLGRCVHAQIGIKVTNYTGIWLTVWIGVSIYKDMGYCMDIITCTWKNI